MPRAVAWIFVFALTLGAGARESAAQPAPPADDRIVYHTTGTRVGIGRSIHVPADQEVQDTVVVVGGSLRLDGRVRDGIVVVGGNLDIGPTADVRGEIVMVGGRISRHPDARVHGRINDIAFGDWSSWSIGHIGFPRVRFGDATPWLSLFGTMFRLSFLAVLMGLTVLVARAPVARIGRAAGAEPAKAFALGLVTELLFVPALVIASLALIVTIIGIPLVALLVPLAVFTAFVALLLGFTALTCRVGEWLQDRVSWRGSNAFLATGLGLLLILTPTLLARMVGLVPAPVQFAGWGLLAIGILLEFVVWTMGLGATLMTGFGRWSTAPPPVPPLPDPDALPVTS